MHIKCIFEEGKTKERIENIHLKKS